MVRPLDVGGPSAQRPPERWQAPPGRSASAQRNQLRFLPVRLTTGQPGRRYRLRLHRAARRIALRHSRLSIRAGFPGTFSGRPSRIMHPGLTTGMGRLFTAADVGVHVNAPPAPGRPTCSPTSGVADNNRRKGPLTRISSSTWPKIRNTTVSVSGSAGPMYGRSELRSEIDHDLTADMAGRLELDGCADVLDGEGQGRFGRSVVVRNLSGPPVRGRHHRARPRHRPRPRGRGACLRVLPERESPSGAAGTKPTGRPPAARAPLQPPEPRACLRYVIDCRR